MFFAFPAQEVFDKLGLMRVAIQKRGPAPNPQDEDRSTEVTLIVPPANESCGVDGPRANKETEHSYSHKIEIISARRKFTVHYHVRRICIIFWAALDKWIF